MGYREDFRDATSLSDKQVAAEGFLKETYNAMWTQLEPSKDILVKICVELDNLDNEFTTFLDSYIQLNNKVPSRNGIVALNNLYARGIIDDNNLDATDEDGNQNKSILFNANIYNLPTSDIEFIITSYYWLTEDSNIGRMNLDELRSNASTSQDIRDVAMSMQNDKDINHSLRNVIIYAIDSAQALSNGSTRSYNIRQRDEIERILHIASSRTNLNQGSADKVKKILKDFASLTDDEKDALKDMLQDIFANNSSQNTTP